MIFRLHSGSLLSYSKKKRKRKLAKVTTRFYSLSFFVNRCQSLLLVLPRGQSLSLDVPLVCLIINDRRCTATSKQFILRHMMICQLLNDTNREKLCTQLSTRIAVWLLLTFHMFLQSVKFYTFYYHVLKSTDVWKMWFIK